MGTQNLERHFDKVMQSFFSLVTCYWYLIFSQHQSAQAACVFLSRVMMSKRRTVTVVHLTGLTCWSRNERAGLTTNVLVSQRTCWSHNERAGLTENLLLSVP